mgnify:CR=1 FL=1
MLQNLGRSYPVELYWIKTTTLKTAQLYLYYWLRNKTFPILYLLFSSCCYPVLLARLHFMSQYLPLVMSLVNCPGMSPSCIVLSESPPAPGEFRGPWGSSSGLWNAFMGELSMPFISEMQLFIEPCSLISCRQKRRHNRLDFLSVVSCQ